jgi:hypothetical protein
MATNRINEINTAFSLLGMGHITVLSIQPTAYIFEIEKSGKISSSPKELIVRPEECDELGKYGSIIGIKYETDSDTLRITLLPTGSTS